MSNKFKEYIRSNILITDGAMGTYYNTIRKTDTKICEKASLTEPETILAIHKAYIKAGAKLIRTNTFAANSMHFDRETVKEIIGKSVEIAKEAAKSDIFIGASIGPNFSERETFLEYEFIVNEFLSYGIDIFILETQADLENTRKVAEYIKNKNKNAYIITQFALSDTGSTRFAVTAEKIVREAKADGNIDMLGFNCGVGPVHMIKILKKLHIDESFSILPNAGYPEIINDKPEYPVKPEYFADVTSEAVKLGARIIGGCCGTTPDHIKKLSAKISEIKNIPTQKINNTHIEIIEENSVKNNFNTKIDNKEFLIAVEMMSPFGTDISKLIEGAAVLREKGADIITIADCPMGKARAESTMIASKIAHETGTLVMPHLCCRDRNITALRASILAAYIDGIRNILVVTGDPAVGDVKPVFNLSSYTLINMINEMNNNEFANDPIYIGGAANFNVKNKNSEYKRLLKKVENGAKYFLTQPVFTDETIDFIKNMDKERNFLVLGGLMPPVSYKNVQFINNEMTGIDIPEKYAARFTPDMDRETAQNIGIEIAVEIASRLKPYVDGFYIHTPFNRFNMVAEVLKRI